MKLVSKIEIKTYATNIKELYIGFFQDNILNLIQLFKSYDSDYYQGELYFNYKQNYSIYFKVITRHNGSNHQNPFSDDRKPLECETEAYELGNYQSIYKLEIDEKKVRFDELYYDDYFYEYTIKKRIFC
jgi:hypothetical protein